MPVSPTYPGVYVQEIPSGVRAIAGVSTSIAMFVARARKGPLNEARRLFSYTDFERTFSADTSVSDLADHVRLFFLNGGTDCYVMRIANGAVYAEVTLENEANQDVLVLTAKEAGVIGNSIRAIVSYGGADPEGTFNLDLFREETDALGRVTISDNESFKNLSMDPDSLNYAPTVLTDSSRLVDAEAAAVLPVTANGFSMSGAPVLYVDGDVNSFIDQWAARVGDDPAVTGNRFNISVDGSRYVPIMLGGIDVATLNNASIDAAADDLAGRIQQIINDTLAASNIAGTTVTVEVQRSTDGASFAPTPGANALLDDGATAADASSVLVIRSDNADDVGRVRILPSNTQDLAVPLRLGSAQGGLEVSAFSGRRPAPSGITLIGSNPAFLRTLAEVQQGQIAAITLDATDLSGALVTVDVPLDLVDVNAADLLWEADGGLVGSVTAIAEAINAYRNSNPTTFFWSAAQSGGRLTLTSSTGGASAVGGLNIVPTVPADPVAAAVLGLFVRNTRNYSFDVSAATNFQSAPVAGDDGIAPTLPDYSAAFNDVDKQVDLFNLMVIPADSDPAAVPLSQVYGVASVFCQTRRAFLIMDAPADWDGAQEAATQIASMRIGIVRDHSAIYYPRILIPVGRTRKAIGASGAAAGVYARIDSTRGVWKAPAGVEADIRGIVGLEQQFSDREHGAMNPLGINVLRAFPNGLVIYGARTNAGSNDEASEYKYVPIRRLALYIEESLYRGLKWVVFEPNDEPLWGQIRLNVGTFMQDLFRRGAFEGRKPSDAYFVKCDRETTTPSDRNLGIVNILVGFAPLKPAEFVVLQLQQMTAEAQT
ncbi:MAG: phage tail sheath family protein [Chloroflexi bacterium]|nr:phage tail sheath family protein [Chloroflexota bacterium]